MRYAMTPVDMIRDMLSEYKEDALNYNIMGNNEQAIASLRQGIDLIPRRLLKDPSVTNMVKEIEAMIAKLEKGYAL